MALKMDPSALKTKTIGVLMGGMSGEREVSFRSGRNCVTALESLGYNVVGIDVLQDVAQRLDEEKVEVAFLALHGRYGEDGTIQGLLEIMGIPYTGSGVLASALGMNKIAAKKIVRGSGIQTPDYREIKVGEDPVEAAGRVVDQLGLPVMVKPADEGSSLGVSKCNDRQALADCLKDALPKYGAMFAEQFVTGTETTIGVIQRGGRLEALPILELVPKNDFYDFEAKYTEGMTEFILPARLEPPVYEKAQRTAIEAFEAIECRGYARVDVMVDREGSPWFIEVNTLPGMTELSDLPAQARAAGMSYEELVETILLTAVS